MLRFSANLSMLFTEVALPERFQLAKQHGFDAVEVQFPFSIPAETLQNLLTQNDLKLVLFNVDADDLLQGGEGLASVPEKQVQFKTALAQAVRYAEILKPHAINILPGRCLNPERYSDYLDTFKHNLGLALAAFTPLGIKTVFEAINTVDMPNFMISTEQHMLDMLRALSHPALLMQYDIYHMHKMQQNPLQFIQQYADKIGHIQFADNPGRGQPSTGEIDFEALFKAIATSAYTGWVGAEYRPVGATEESLGWLAAELKNA